MLKKQFSRLISLWILMLFTCGTYAEIHPISSWDLQVDKSGSGADTVWMLNGFTFIDYNMPIEDIVYGVTEGGSNNPAINFGPIPNIDNPNLYLMADRANNEHCRTTQFGGQSLWSDGNGDKYDFFIFESSYENQTETFLIKAIMADGTLGGSLSVVGSHWRPSTLNPPEPSIRDGLGLIRSSDPQSDKGPWGIAFKVTDLKDANGDPLTNYSLIQGLQIASAGADFCLICAAKAGGPPVALNPIPVEGALETTSTVSLSWDKGNRMASQKIYLSTNQADVATGAEAALLTTQAETSLDAQVEGGQTYYWRVDTIDDADALAPGNVWSFQTVPNTASQPIPYDGGKFVAIAPMLTWVPGLDAQSYTVVFGTDPDAVAAATDGVVVTEPSYTPDPLLNETVYYWRVDANDGTTTPVAGTVWQFTTARETGGLMGRYYHGEFGALILTRIDPVIDIAWADASDPNMPVDTDAEEFSVRWQGELEVPEDGSYTFTLFTSDFARLIIDGIEVIDDWNEHAEREVSGVINLTTGYHGIAVDHWKEGADTNVDVRLSWESGMFTREIVPSGALIPEPKADPVWPLNGADEVAQAPRLMWMGIAPDAKHQVYLGQTPESLNSAGEVEGDASLLVEGLAPGSLYYWRIDEVVGDQTTEGRVWQFTTAADMVIDDAENYTDRDDQAIWITWMDGYSGNGSGSYAGYPVLPYAEEIVVHGGRQSLPLVYDNTGQFSNINGQKTGATYSEISRSVQPQNWSGQKTLQLWYHGSSPGSFTYDTESETYTIEGVGLGFGGTEDRCTFVYGQLTGDGTIVARIENFRADQAYQDAARVGVMMRESLDPDAKSVTMSIGGDAIVRIISRTAAGTADQTTAVQTAVWFPHYVRIVRQGDVLRTSYSPDGVNWAEDIDVESFSMNATVYIGLIVSSNAEAAPLKVTFADVQVTGNVVPQPFAEFKVLGLAGSVPEPLYVKVKDSSGGEATLVHPDADAILTSVWKSWSIDLQVLAGQGLNLNAVDTLTLGVGEPAKMGGNGAVLFDDIRLLTE